jgi:hypothetical protein
MTIFAAHIKVTNSNCGVISHALNGRKELATRGLLTILSIAHNMNTNYEITTGYNIVTLYILYKLVGGISKN